MGSSMSLTVLGCSGSMPGPDSPASGYLLEAEGFRLVLDLGNGAFGTLQRFVDPASVDAIFVSHLHADHCIDLTSYIVSLRYGGGGYRSRDLESRITLIGPSGTRDRLEAAYDPLARKLGLHELFGFTTPIDGELGPFTVSYATVNHPVPTNAIKVSYGGSSIVYSGDTGVSDELVTLARDADVLLCEASVGPDEEYVPDLHLTGKQAGEHAAEAGVGRLILTHIPPWVAREQVADHAASAYTGPIELAECGRRFTI
jgi:ribonuclease BN (tRNA processing enzyme)